MGKQSEINIKGVFKNKDGTPLSWKEFTERLTSIGLVFNGDIVSTGSNAIEKEKPKPKPITLAQKFKKSDWGLIKDAESEGLMVSMSGLVERVRTDLNNELSSYFRKEEPGYLGVFDENSKVDYESVLDYINEYLKEKGVNKNLSLPMSSGSELYLVPITANLEVKVLVADEYHGEGESETYVMIDMFKITENCGTEDVDELIKFVNKYLE